MILKALYFAVSCCLTSIIGREYNLFALGIMLLWLKDQLSQAAVKTKFLFLKMCTYLPYSFTKITHNFLLIK